jgi:hypothetical protein
VFVKPARGVCSSETRQCLYRELASRSLAWSQRLRQHDDIEQRVALEARRPWRRLAAFNASAVDLADVEAALMTLADAQYVRDHLARVKRAVVVQSLPRQREALERDRRRRPASAARRPATSSALRHDSG